MGKMVGILTITFCYSLNTLYMVFASYRDQLARIWMDSCIKAGLRSPSMKHGLNIQDGSQADRYVAKWGLPEEMSKAI